MAPMFYLLAGMTMIGALASMTLRNPVHCALCLVVTFAGLAGLYLDLGSQFLGFAQVVVYIGAVAILIMFVMLLTRSSDPDSQERPPAWRTGVWVGGSLLAVLALAVMSARTWAPRGAEKEVVPVADIGRALMTEYVLPLQVVAVLLTSAMIGAAVLAIPERKSRRNGTGKEAA